ncbi:glycosyltransferase [Salegentibacter chungangensis]|uniref:Glycosyltransferase n=1 Tax=Salegentibacter chungangensis TaxID=1335724 RepID=A0ABW3NL05_9FLAO
MQKKRVLVAALNWGLGHATRCIPIIEKLQEQNFEPVLASDGAALALLRKEHPHLKSFELPSYNIEYASSGSLLKWKLLLNTPSILNAIKLEKLETEKLVKTHNINGVISDNRFGVRSELVKSVFITHQLNVLSGNTTYLSSKLHQNYIRKFDECWIPDMPGAMNLSGILGHLKKQKPHIKYIGPLSRFEKKELRLKYQMMVLLSGPEPQRTILEKILLRELGGFQGKLLFVRGVMEGEEIASENPNLKIRNHMYGKELEEAVNSSELVLCRSGYSSIMDLSKLEKKAFFIPTPGQFEQEYLAERLKTLGIAPFCRQEDFSLKKLEELKNYSGFGSLGFSVDFSRLLALFQGE